MTVVAAQSDGTLRCVWFQEDGKQDGGGFLRKSRFAPPRRKIPGTGRYRKPSFDALRALLTSSFAVLASPRAFFPVPSGTRAEFPALGLLPRDD